MTIAATRPLVALLLAAGCSAGGEGQTPSDGGPPDAALDAAPRECEADHAESAEGQNDLFSGPNQPEETGQVLTRGGEPFTLCGKLDPAQATPQVTDADFYRFDVLGTEPITVRIELRGPEELEAGRVSLDLWTSSRQHLGGGRFLGAHAVIAGVPLPPGPYMVSVAAFDEIAEASFYEIAVLENPHECPAASGVPDYEEAPEGPGHRENDVIEVRYTPLMTAAETPAGDQPEATELVVSAGETYQLRGHSADVESAGDAYLDRDTFLFATDEQTDELEIRLRWPAEAIDVDMDLFLFPEGEPSDELTGGAGSLVATGTDELVTVNVAPGRSYWLWVATFDDRPALLPVDYSITLCARRFPETFTR